MVKFLRKRFLTDEQEKRVIEAIRQAESGTTAEICVHLRKKCKKDVLVEAQTYFKKLKLDRTRQKNAVLIFVALEDRRFAVVGDRGIHEKVRDAFWESVRDLLGDRFRAGDIAGGLAAAARCIGEEAKKNFPAAGKHFNQLPDTVTED